MTLVLIVRRIPADFEKNVLLKESVEGFNELFVLTFGIEIAAYLKKGH